MKTERLQSCSCEEDVLAVEINILDGAGVLCTNWDGNVRVSVTGAVSLRAFTSDGIIPVSGGIGRTYVCGSGSGGRASVEASCLPLVFGRSDFSISQMHV